jgi:hypothetical protein
MPTLSIKNVSIEGEFMILEVSIGCCFIVTFSACACGVLRQLRARELQRRQAMLARAMRAGA